jgi:hypothetical protein
MITIEQAKALQHGDKIKQTHERIKCVYVDNAYHRHQAISWRVNGKVKTWKRDPNRFQVPIKHSRYVYGYLTNDNAGLFMLNN